MKNCDHSRKIRSMEWPDGGTSELCGDCLKTRYIDDSAFFDFHDQTDWQDHKYRSPADWYAEAVKVQKALDISVERARKSKKS